VKIALLTKEFPPHIYGGAGVHVASLTHELAQLDHGTHDIHVWCFGDQQERRANLTVRGIQPRENRSNGYPVFLDTLMRDVVLSSQVKQADVVHCHTWYTHLAGCLLKQMLRVPFVLTTHSLEPHRPWKREQLGPAYDAAAWIEKTAYQNADGVIAVSASMKADVRMIYDVPENKIEVIHNGIDLHRYQPTKNPRTVAAYGIDPAKPYILMVSRLTRQKGIFHFLSAVRHLETDVQPVLCASVPDTPEFMEEVSEAVSDIERETGKPIIWVKKTVPVEDLVVLYSHADIFVCPSIYEPFGIINLEAMACGTPVVASAVGGIPEAVVHDQTGRLVSFQPVSRDNSEPREPERFARDLAKEIDALLDSPDTLHAMGRNARGRVEAEFSWPAIARKTVDFYRRLG